MIGLERFGASAPAATIFEHFGFTVPHVVEVARGVLAGTTRGVVSAPLPAHGEPPDAAGGGHA